MSKEVVPVMAVTYGQLAEFNPDQENFRLYNERLENWFAANTVDSTKKVAIFLTLIGGKGYATLHDLCQPSKPSECSYSDLVALLLKHYSPAPILIAQRFKFHKRVQAPDESVADFLIDLRRLASFCQFGDFLEESIRDRFVCGLYNAALQKRLLTVADLTLASATELAFAMELADKDVLQIRDQHQSSAAAICNMYQASHQQPRSTNPGSTRQRQSTTRSQHRSTKCHRCGGPHHPATCRWISASCYACGGQGHIAKVCRRKPSDVQQVKAVNFADSSVKPTSNSRALYSIVGQVGLESKAHKNKYTIPVSLNNVQLIMCIDTAADVSTVSSYWLRSNLPDVKIEPHDLRLHTYTGESVPIEGKAHVYVDYQGQRVYLDIVVVSGNCPPLFGRDWLSTFKIDWANIFQTMQVSNGSTDTINSLCTEFADLFAPASGPIKGTVASVHLKPDAQPVFRKFRPVPFSLKEAVEKQINENVASGIWVPVEHSNWATPLVIVSKKSGAVRLCADYSVSVNPVLDVTQYPLPSQMDMFSSLAGNVIFSAVDCQSAYTQLLLDPASQEILTVNTHLGLMRPTRLMFGLASAAAIFQKAIDGILRGLPSVGAFQDDILASGRSVPEHMSTLRQLFIRLREHSVSLNSEKCKFLQTKISYLGHDIDSKGIHPTQEKIEVIRKLIPPGSVTELRSFLGIINYYGKFFPNLSTELAPLFDLLHKDVKWSWSTACDQAFQRCKQFLTSDALLVHYDQSKPVKLYCDASAVGLGAVLSHVMPDGTDRPIAYASRTLSSAERNYSQIEREALAIVYAVKHFQVYLVGRSFTLVTDHQPLVMLFGHDKPVPTLAAARIQRWALLLSQFQYKIEFKRGVEHLNADTLSRIRHTAHINEDDYSVDPEVSVFKLSCVQDLPVTCIEISTATLRDPVLGRVLSYVQSGWPTHCPSEDLAPYFTRREQLSVDCGCVVWGLRVIVPDLFRATILALLHDTHPGITRMKGLARCYVWWPKLDADIEQLVRSCHQCQVLQPDPPRAPHQPWAWPTSPWHRLHIDLAHILGHDCLVVFDTHSKWIETLRLSSLHSSSIIEHLRTLFAQFGVPSEIVSDNGPQFVAAEFATFTRKNGIRHTLVPTYKPASNGAAERAVRLIKSTLSHMSHEIHNIKTFQASLSRALFTYRITPHTVTGRSPAEMFLARCPRSCLTLLRPGAVTGVEPTPVVNSPVVRSFVVGQPVWVRSFGWGDKWVQGSVLEVQSSRTYRVRIGTQIRSVHVDQLRADRSAVADVFLPGDDQPTNPAPPNSPNVPIPAVEVVVEPVVPVAPPSPDSPVRRATLDQSPHVSPPRLRPSRVLKPVDRYRP